MRPPWLGCRMTCFCCITGTTIIYSVHEHVFESPWLCDVNRVGTDLVHWLYFDLYICALKLTVPVATNGSVSKIESMEEYSEAKT